MGTEVATLRDQSGTEYRRVPYRLGENGALVPEQGGTATIGLEPGSTVVLWVPQSGAAGGVIYGGPAQGGSQPVVYMTPPQSPQVLVISNSEAKKPPADSKRGSEVVKRP